MFGLNMAKLDILSRPMMSEAYTSFFIMMVSLEIIKLPDWLPPNYNNRANNFERLRWCTPALVSDMGSDPEGFVTIKSLTSLPV